MDAALPASILDLLKPVAAQIYAEGAKAEDGRTLEHTERLHRPLGDLEAEVEALASANQSLEGQVAALTQQQAAAETASVGARATIARQADKISALEGELARHHAEATSQIAGLLQGFEKAVAGLAERIESAAPRNAKTGTAHD